MNKMCRLLLGFIVAVLLSSCVAAADNNVPPTPKPVITVELKISAGQVLVIGNARYQVRNEGSLWSIGGFQVKKGGTVVLKDGYDDSSNYQRVSVYVDQATSSVIQVVVKMVLEELIFVR